MPAPSILILTQGHAGDRLGSRLTPALRERFPHHDLLGVGGSAMEGSGIPLIARADSISAMGWTGLPPLLPALMRVLSATLNTTRRRPPSAVVAVDVWQPLQILHRRSPELRAAPHVCYLPPGPNLIGRTRVHDKAAAAFAAIVTPFPHQARLFGEAGARTRLAAHAGLQAMLTEVQPVPAAERESILALLPGSRAAEIRYGLSVQWEAAQRVVREHPQLRPLVCCADDAVEREVRARFPQAEIHRNARAVLARARFGIICSGTASLEAAVLGCPGVVTYNVSPLQQWEWRRFHAPKLAQLRADGIASPYIALPNILVERQLYPELLEPTAEEVAAATLAGLGSDLASAHRDLTAVRDVLGWDDAGSVVADEVARALGAGAKP